MRQLLPIIAAAGMCSVATAQCETDRLIPADNGAGDWFGWTMDADGDVLAISAMLDDDIAAESGAVHVYEYNGASWTHITKLAAGDGGESDQFGEAVAVSGDAIAVGVHRHDGVGEDQGAVYIYRRGTSGWSLEQKIDNPDPTGTREVFGYAVDIDGDLLTASAIWDVNDDGKTGATYVFRFDGTSWNLETKLTPPDAETNSNFGQSVSIHGSTLVVGVPFSDEVAIDSGAAWVYRFDGASWTSQGKIVPADAQTQDYFGATTALGTGSILLGSWNRGHSGADLWDGAGAAVEFRRSGPVWLEGPEIAPPTEDSADSFSNNGLELDGDTLLAGAMGDDSQGEWSGAAYIYRRNGTGWDLEQTIRPADLEAADFFGTRPQLARGHLLVGMSGDEDNGTDSGSVRVFQLTGCDPCPADFNGDGAVNTLDVLSFLNAWNTGCP